MKLKNKIILGIDTSCYTTSIAAINLENNVILNKKNMLKVKKGDKGLRQSEGVFQHVNNLGDMFENIKEELRDFEIAAVCVSSRPRSVKGSYMPVFICGYQFAKAISSTLGIPIYETSHQEGHIEAAYSDTNISTDKFICVHMSGGTTEILLTHKLENYKLEIIGGTKDISIGQLIDRIGVKLGYPFPCGLYIDNNAVNFNEPVEKLIISSKEGYMNFSGTETKIYSLIEKHSNDYICRLALSSISDSLFKSLLYLCKKYDVENVLFVGGVSSSKYISLDLRTRLKNKNINSYWTNPEYAKDNAVGVAMIGLNRFLGGI